MVLLLLSASAAEAIELFLHSTAPIPDVPVLDSVADGQYPDPTASPPNPGIIVYKNPVTLLGVSLSGQFAGQTSGSITMPPPSWPPSAQTLSYETITGLPTLNAQHAMELVDQGVSRNLQVIRLSDIGYDVPGRPDDKLVGGLLDTPDQAQGAVTLLFDRNVSIFGLEMIGANFEFGSTTVGDPGHVYFQFFREDGRLIGSPIAVTAYDGPLWFRSLDVLIRGVTITNDDYQGIGYAHFRFNPAPPAPVLLASGLALLVWVRRRLG